MAIELKSGAGADIATVDPTSKALRVTNYDSSGAEAPSSTAALQTTGNSSLSNIDTKLTDGTQRTQLASIQGLNFGSAFTPLNELLSQQPIRLGGQTFTGTTLDTEEWSTSGIVGTGAVTQANNMATMATGTTANSAVTLRTRVAMRFMFGNANQFRAIVKTSDTGTANNIRRMGVGDGTDSLGFMLNGTTFGIYYQNNGTTTEITSGFNGTLGTTYTWTTAPTILEIIYFSAGYWFFINGALLHHIALSTLTMQLCQKLTLPIQFTNTNSGGSTTNIGLDVWNACVFRLGNSHQRPKHKSVTANGTYTLKLGAGTLRRIIIDTSGATNNTLAIYDNTTATGTLIATMNTTAAGGSFDYDVDFYTGLTVVLSTGTAAKLTFIYD